MPRQELIFLKSWSKPGCAIVPCPVEPSRIWTLFREEDEARPPALPIIPVHRVNAFSEDYVHDWNWRRHGSGPAMLDYFSRVADGPVWILLEFDTAEDIVSRVKIAGALSGRDRGPALIEKLSSNRLKMRP